jgi:hypothetical protein
MLLIHATRDSMPCSRTSVYSIALIRAFPWNVSHFRFGAILDRFNYNADATAFRTLKVTQSVVRGANVTLLAQGAEQLLYVADVGSGGGNPMLVGELGHDERRDRLKAP